MSNLQYHLGKIRLQLRGKNKIVGWNMKPEEVKAFFISQKKTVLTLFGYSKNYEDQQGLLEILQRIFSRHSPQTTIINIGGTRGGIGTAYPLAKSKGFTTTGITSTRGIKHSSNISDSVDYICFIKDDQWGGKIPNSNELSPTSEAMVICSDILIGIGGGKISRDELLLGKKMGKPIEFYSAEIEHEGMIKEAKDMGLPEPKSFWGEAHEHFGGKQK